MIKIMIYMHRDFFCMISDFISSFDETEDSQADIDEVQKYLVRVLNTYKKYTTSMKFYAKLDSMRLFFKENKGSKNLLHWLKTNRIIRVKDESALILEGEQRCITEGSHRNDVIYFNDSLDSKEVYMITIENDRIERFNYDRSINRDTKLRLIRKYFLREPIDLIILFDDIHDEDFFDQLQEV